MIYLLVLNDTNAERVRNVIRAAKIRVLWAAPDETTVGALAPLLEEKAGQLTGKPIDYYLDYLLLPPTHPGVPQVPNQEANVEWKAINYVQLINNWWKIPKSGETVEEYKKRLEQWYHLDFIKHFLWATETPTAIVVRPEVLEPLHELLCFHGGRDQVILNDDYIGAYKVCKFRTCLKQQIR
jgi:hypothetical protein